MSLLSYFFRCFLLQISCAYLWDYARTRARKSHRTAALQVHVLVCGCVIVAVVHAVMGAFPVFLAFHALCECKWLVELAPSPVTLIL